MFDPFRDFETRGYLRNLEQEKDLAIVKRIEHASFMTGLDEALATLMKRGTLGYDDVLTTHGTLFDAVYPWAGQDRVATAPLLTIRKGPVIFANPSEIRPAIEHGLRLGQDKAIMTARPGEVMGYLAFGHPFLDGNGRTIMTLFSIMAQRAGFGIDWSATSKPTYLEALTHELERPGKGILDAYLLPFVGAPIAYEKLASRITSTPGLDGATQSDPTEIVGNSDELAVKAQYEQMLRNRIQK